MGAARIALVAVDRARYGLALAGRFDADDSRPATLFE